jgi:hypothetical protein
MNEETCSTPLQHESESMDRKPWQDPMLEILPVDQTEADFTGGTDIGFFGS